MTFDIQMIIFVADSLMNEYSVPYILCAVFRDFQLKSEYIFDRLGLFS